MVRLIIVLAVAGLFAFIAVRSSWKIERNSDKLREEQRHNVLRERDFRSRPPVR